MTDITLPPLPPTAYALAREGDGYSPDRLLNEAGYTYSQMFDYATAAVLAERERCASLVERATSKQRALRAAVNGTLSAGVEPCALAALIRKRGNP